MFNCRPELAAAVTNAGGIGVLGGVGYTPKFLRRQIAELKSHLVDKNAPFGVDLRKFDFLLLKQSFSMSICILNEYLHYFKIVLPQIGGGARKTNSDYTEGKLPELIDIIIESKATMFVCAIGVAPRWAVDKLHKAGILYMNMIGAPKHVAKALNAGADIICAQGGEGGGHTGAVATSILIPVCFNLIYFIC